MCFFASFCPRHSQDVIYRHLILIDVNSKLPTCNYEIGVRWRERWLTFALPRTISNISLVLLFL